MTKEEITIRLVGSYYMPSPEISAAFQKMVNKFGYKWGRSSVPSHTGKRFIILRMETSPVTRFSITHSTAYGVGVPRKTVMEAVELCKRLQA